MYEWLPSSIEEAKEIFKENSLDWDFKLNSSIDNKDIMTCERELAMNLPDGYKQFVHKHNGAHLFCSKVGNVSESNTWWADSGIVLFGTKTILEYRPLIYESFVYDDDSSIEDYYSILPIAYLGRLMTGDFCSIDLSNPNENNFPVIDCNHELPPSEWKKSVIASSMNEWLEHMFRRVIQSSEFPEYWIESDSKDSSLALA